MKKTCVKFGGAMALFVAFGALNAADTPDKPPSYQTSGDIYGTISKVDDKSITIRTQVPTRTGGGRTARITQKNQDMVMSFTPDAHARLKQLPPKLDDNGKKTFYSPDELRKLKGPNTTLPGYQVELSQLRAGQQVQAHIVHDAKEPNTNLVRWVLIIDDGQQKNAPNK